MFFIEDVARLVDSFCEIDCDDDPDPIAVLRVIVRLSNLIDHRASVLVGRIDRDVGRRSRELLIGMGFAPAVAARLLRIARSDVPVVAAHAAEGRISGEHADAIVRGLAHINSRAPDVSGPDERRAHAIDLLAQHSSGATPAEILDRARRIGNEVAAESGGLPAAEDRSINTLDHGRDADGRLRVSADLDVEVGEKLIAAIEELSAPRPEPDGSPDGRSASRRRADALEALLDMASRGSGMASAPRTQVLLTIPADKPTGSRLAFMGPVTESFAYGVVCDSGLTPVVVDAEAVPLDIGREKRLFPAHLRKALYVRDQCCIKCGAPAGRTHAHHIVHWADGGETALENGCLLCPACHADVHHNGWEVMIGADRHPWLLPPADVDPGRTRMPAYNRRTLNLDRLAA